MDYTEDVVLKLGGMGVVRPVNTELAHDIVNMTFTPDGVLSSRMGYEKYFTGSTTYAPWNATRRVTSLFSWEREDGAQFLMHTIGSNLQYVQGNPAAAIVVRSDLIEPGPTDPGMRYAPFGVLLIMANGYDTAFLFNGETWRPIGWTTLPAAPHVWDVMPTVLAAVPPGYTRTFAPGATQGVGTADDAAKNRYKYKVAFVSDTGGVSPLSGASNEIAWTTEASLERFAVFIDSIPVGPPGTVARYIYRTQNIETTFSERYYLVGRLYNNSDTTYWDTLNDLAMVEIAPSVDESVTCPVANATAIAVYSGCLWAVNKEDPYTLLRSVPGSPDQYPALGFFGVSASHGGPIRALVPYGEVLFVIRDNAIDVVMETATDYMLKPVTSGIGMVAAGTVSVLPEKGVLMLTSRGVYLCSSGRNPYTGEIESSATLISGEIEHVTRRVNQVKLPTASAVFSALWQEWHCYYDVGTTRVGLVLSSQGKWTTRVGFPVGPLAVDGRGNLIFGHRDGAWNAAGTLVNPLAAAGLFVISRRRTAGHTVVSGQQEWWLIDGPPLVSSFVSAWHDMGARSVKKAVRYVRLYLRSTGTDKLALFTAKDGQLTYTTGKDHDLQAPEGLEQSVWNTAVFETAQWEGAREIDVRYDIPPTTAGAFRFKFETSADVELVGYAVGVTAPVNAGMKGRG